MMPIKRGHWPALLFHHQHNRIGIWPFDRGIFTDTIFKDNQPSDSMVALLAIAGILSFIFYMIAINGYKNPPTMIFQMSEGTENITQNKPKLHACQITRCLR
jgi:hypothetical protein